MLPPVRRLPTQTSQNLCTRNDIIQVIHAATGQVINECREKHVGTEKVKTHPADGPARLSLLELDLFSVFSIAFAMLSY